MAGENVTNMSLTEVREFLEERHPVQECLDAVDTVLGLVLAVAGTAVGAATGPDNGLLFWHALEPKSVVVDALRAGVRKLSARGTAESDVYLERARRMAAANCLLVYTAYFDALMRLWPEIVATAGLGAPEARAELLNIRELGGRRADDAARITRAALPVPRLGSDDMSGYLERADLYAELALDLRRGLKQGTISGKPTMRYRSGPGQHSVEGSTETGSAELSDLLLKRLPVMAESFYRAEYMGLLGEFGQFFNYAFLQQRMAESEHFRRAEEFQSGAIGWLKQIAEEQQSLFAKISLAMRRQDGRLDAGLRDLRSAIGALPVAEVAAGTGRGQDSSYQEIARRLHEKYEGALEKPVIAGQWEPDGDEARLSFPRKKDAFIPQAYRLAHCDSADLHLEREDSWEHFPVQEDVGACVVRLLEDPYSIITPLLILGQPGSGKSLLTEVLAGNLGVPASAESLAQAYTVVRLRLRDYDPKKKLLAQVVEQVNHDTAGEDVTWAGFARTLAATPPVVILDGYDELLQATGKTHEAFLDMVREEQETQRDNGQPMRVIVTSRVTLIDKVGIPDGTPVIRLEEFDDKRQAQWTGVWNAENTSSFRQAQVEPFQLPANKNIASLARQPLLLLMLAIYDSAKNELSSQPDIDQTLLYDRLLRRFIDRELAKRPDGAAYRALRRSGNPSKAAEKVDEQLRLLGVAAIAMFNRQDTKILATDLDKDLAYFSPEPADPPEANAVGPALLLLGSFFFIQKSEGRSGTDPGPVAFEFLHNTFGEFLAADFILRCLLEELREISDLSGRRRTRALDQTLSSPCEAFLGCLLHTPLFTRPVILKMTREWCMHRLGEEREELLAAFDRLVMAHLRIALDSFTVPNSGEPSHPPYEELPMRGRVATYTLNLLLLRAHAGWRGDARTEFHLPEAAIGESAQGQRPWDSLVHLWYAWFPLESLGSLEDVFSAYRRDDVISISPSRTPITRDMGPVGLSYAVSVSLGDDLGAAVSGLHVAAEGALSRQEFTNLRQHIEARVPELAESADLLYRKSFSADAMGSKEPNAYPRISRNYLDRVELDARLTRSPKQWLELKPPMVESHSLLFGTRYTTEVLTESCSQLYPGAVADLLQSSLIDRPSVEGVGQGLGWPEFCVGYGAAPVLRWAIRYLSRGECALITSDARKVLSSSDLRIVDIETAAALAILTASGDKGDLCGQVLARIVAECRTGNWNLLDISVETWERLADLFATGSPVETQDAKAEFIAVLESAITESITATSGNSALYHARGPLALFWIHALRIGAIERQDRLISAVINKVIKEPARLAPGWRRKCLLALACWVRERGDQRLALDIFGGELRYAMAIMLGLADEATAIEKLEAATGRLLTYREAMDVRWVFENVPATMSAAEIQQAEALASTDSSGQGSELAAGLTGLW